MTDHDELRRSLGSYLVGALEPVERAEVEQHLAGCDVCRGELASLAGLPGLMSRLSAGEARTGTLEPPSSLLPRSLAAVQAERAGRRRHLRRWQGATAAALAAAAVAVAVVALPGGSGSAGRPLVVAAGSTSAGRVSYAARPWGTQVHLELRGLPRRGTFTAWAVDRAGTRTAAATWRATANGQADVIGAAAVERTSLTELRVSSDDGTVLLRGNA